MKSKMNASKWRDAKIDVMRSVYTKLVRDACKKAVASRKERAYNAQQKAT